MSRHILAFKLRWCRLTVQCRFSISASTAYRASSVQFSQDNCKKTFRGLETSENSFCYQKLSPIAGVNNNSDPSTFLVVRVERGTHMRTSLEIAGITKPSGVVLISQACEHASRFLSSRNILHVSVNVQRVEANVAKISLESAAICEYHPRRNCRRRFLLLQLLSPKVCENFRHLEYERGSIYMLKNHASRISCVPESEGCECWM